MTTRFSEYVSTAILLFVFLASIIPVNAQNQPANDQVIDGDQFEDHTLSFAIERPSSKWEFYLERDIGQISPDARMGLASGDTGGYFVVIPEENHGISLEVYTNRVVDHLNLEDAEVSHREMIQLAGTSAFEIEASGSADGLQTTAVLFILKHGDFFFQLTGWSPTPQFSDNESDFHEIANSLAFLGTLDRIAQVDCSSLTLDEQGEDWTISDHRYVNTTFGWEIDATSPWRLTTSSELHSMNPDAVVGLVSTTPRIYQTHVIETVGNVDRETFRTRLAEEISRRIGGGCTPPAARPFAIHGTPGYEYVFSRTHAGSKHVVLTILFEDDRCFQITSWWIGNDRKSCLQEVRNSYSFLSFTETEPLDPVVRETQSTEDDFISGPGFEFSGGVYRNFDYAFEYHCPDSTWRVLTGHRADRVIEGAAIVLESQTRGIHVALIPTPSASARLEDTHRQRSQAMGAPSQIVFETHTTDHHEFLVSEFGVDVDGLPFRVFHCTAAKTDRHFELFVYGLQTTMEAAESTLPDLLAGLRDSSESYASR